MLVLGIDPGLDGALALLDGNALVMAGALPTAEDTTGKRTICSRAFATFLQALVPRPDLTVIEAVHAFPRDHPVSAFSFGRTYGQLLAVLEVLEMPLIRVPPEAWKKRVLAGCDKGKDASIAYVRQRWPLANLRRTTKSRKDSHDYAEAILLAEYGRLYLQGEH